MLAVLANKLLLYADITCLLSSAIFHLILIFAHLSVSNVYMYGRSELTGPSSVIYVSISILMCILDLLNSSVVFVFKNVCITRNVFVLSTAK